MKKLRTNRGKLIVENRNGRKVLTYGDEQVPAPAPAPAPSAPAPMPAPMPVVELLDGRELGFPPDLTDEEKAERIELAVFGPGGPRQGEPEETVPPHARETIPAPPEPEEAPPEGPAPAPETPTAPAVEAPAKKKNTRKKPGK